MLGVVQIIGIKWVLLLVPLPPGHSTWTVVHDELTTIWPVPDFEHIEPALPFISLEEWYPTCTSMPMLPWLQMAG